MYTVNVGIESGVRYKKRKFAFVGNDQPLEVFEGVKPVFILLSLHIYCYF